MKQRAPITSESPPTRMPPMPGQRLMSIFGFLGGATFATFVLLLELTGVTDGGVLMYAIAGVLYVAAVIQEIYPSQFTSLDEWAAFDMSIDHRRHLALAYSSVCKENLHLYAKARREPFERHWPLIPPTIYNCYEMSGDESVLVRPAQLDLDVTNLTHLCFIPVFIGENAEALTKGFFVGALLVRMQRQKNIIKWVGTGIFVKSDADKASIADRLRRELAGRLD